MKNCGGKGVDGLPKKGEWAYKWNVVNPNLTIKLQQKIRRSNMVELVLMD